jgi:hypothetical protein
MDVPPHHLLHIFGTKDNYAPQETQLRFGAGAGLTTLHPVVTGKDLENFITTETMPSPVKLNRMVGDIKITAVQAQYEPGDYDGHFVSTRHPEARASLLYMLASFFRDGMPIVK